MQPKTVIIDFETFFDTKGGYTLRKMPVPEYIMDRRFEVFGMAVDLDGVQDFIQPRHIEDFLHSHNGDVLVMHNAYFDAGILAWRYKYSPALMVDTLLLANHVMGSARESGQGKNDLRTLAKKLGLPLEKGDELKQLDGIRKLSRVKKVILEEYAKNDVALERMILDKLMPSITNPQFEFWLLDHTLRIYTERMLGIDLEKLKTTKTKIEARRKEYVEAAAVAPDILSSNNKFAVELSLRMVKANLKLPTKRAKPRKDGSMPMIPALSKGDPSFIALADSPIKEVAALVKARLVERSAVTVAARLATMEKYAKLGLGIPVHLVYYGAHTGRFSAGGGFNFQNLTSPGRATDPVDREIATLIRECIVPHPTRKDMVLVAVDAAQIEARVEAWLAGEDQILTAFASGADIYSQFISEALGEAIHKPTEADKEAGRGSYLSLMRQVGKEAILGLGYSMGNDKFRERLRKEKNLVPMLEKGQKLSEAVTKGIVDGYRAKYTKIIELWEKLNSAFAAAIKGSTRIVNGKLRFQREGYRVVSITLPSGRKLYYRNLREEWEDGFNGQKRKVWKHGAGQRIYGGLLAENVTQAIARDILAEAIMAAEHNGHPVVLHVHDEIVSRVPKVQGPATLDFLTKTLSTPPAWGKGLVLGAEGHIADNLSK